MGEAVLTRRELYDLVWSKPVRVLAPELGISDVGLLKVCARHRVPTPGRGYWAKKEAGKPVKQAIFVKTADPTIEDVRINGLVGRVTPAVRAVIASERAARADRRPPTPEGKTKANAVLEPISSPHSSVLATVKALRKAKPTQKGLLEAKGPGLCGVSVTPAQLERAICSLDGLARELAARELQLRPAGDSMEVILGPDRVSFTLAEPVKRRKHEPTAEDLARVEALRKKRQRDRLLGRPYVFELAYPEFDYLATGELVLELGGWVRGVRQSWKDGKTQRIEAMSAEIVSGLIAALVSVKEQREEDARRELESRRREERRQRAQARAEREKQRVAFLGRFVELSAEAVRLRTFLTEMQDRMPADPDAEFLRLIAWAEERTRTIEAQLQPSGIAADLRDRRLFPEVDPYAEPPEPVV